MKARAIFSMAALGLATVLILPAAAQNRDWHDRGSSWQQNDHDRNSRAYQDGYRDGQRDQRQGKRHPNDRRWKTDNDRRAYWAGYRAGFGGGDHDWDRDRGRDRDHDGYRDRDRGYNDGRGGYGQLESVARDWGQRDGMSHGQGDRSTGRGYSPTGSQNYEDGDHGWYSGLGDKNTYRQYYRQAYQEAYQRGYYGGSYRDGGSYNGGRNTSGQLERVARDWGYRDGMSHGQGDRSTGRGYSPTGSQNYKDGDHGWYSGLGDKPTYRQYYRQAYQEGYQRGYGR